ncbi:hypothetical protein ACPCJU_14805 [Streptomyces thermodiastaticus]
MQEAPCPPPSSSSDEEDGIGVGPTVAILVVSLVVAAVGVHELCGFGLHALDPRPRLFTNGFTTAGVIVATVAAGAAVGNLAWLLTASRRRAAGTARDGGTGDRNGTGPDGTEREAAPAAVRGVPSAVGAVASSAAAED